MEDKKIMPPTLDEATDGQSDAELLRAISANPECAHVLAAIAAGGDAKSLLASLIPTEPESATEPEPEDVPAAEADVAMYQSASMPSAPQSDVGDSCPAFLACERPDFWDF